MMHGTIGEKPQLMCTLPVVFLFVSTIDPPRSKNGGICSHQEDPDGE